MFSSPLASIYVAKPLSELTVEEYDETWPSICARGSSALARVAAHERAAAATSSTSPTGSRGAARPRIRLPAYYAAKTGVIG